VGFSRGDDPLYREYKEREYVGPFHWTPLEIFSISFPSSEVSAEDLTVISWVLPQSKATKSDNRKEKTYPSERWARARIFGEKATFSLPSTWLKICSKPGSRRLRRLSSLLLLNGWSLNATRSPPPGLKGMSPMPPASGRLASVMG